MTREAKIGLLVALAFLLVIGILLSDHVTTSTRPPLAPLSAVGHIQGSMQTPGGAAQLPEQPTGAPFVYPGAPQPAGELDVRREHLDAQPDPRLTTPAAPANAAGNDPWEAQVPQPPAPQPQAPANQLADIAERAGEPLVPTPGPSAQETSMAGVREYVVQPGDVLSKIVARFMGRDTPANREAIYALNPKLRSDPNRLNVGDKLNVPTSPDAARAAASTAPAVGTPAPQQAAAPVQRTQPTAPRPAEPKLYTVKKGDTLWAIASRQLGDGNRLHEIVRLNADQLSDPDDIAPGMKLKLPA